MALLLKTVPKHCFEQTYASFACLLLTLFTNAIPPGFASPNTSTCLYYLVQDMKHGPQCLALKHTSGGIQPWLCSISETLWRKGYKEPESMSITWGLLEPWWYDCSWLRRRVLSCSEDESQMVFTKRTVRPCAGSTLTDTGRESICSIYQVMPWHSFHPGEAGDHSIGPRKLTISWWRSSGRVPELQGPTTA